MLLKIKHGKREPIINMNNITDIERYVRHEPADPNEPEGDQRAIYGIKITIMYLQSGGSLGHNFELKSKADADEGIKEIEKQFVSDVNFASITLPE